jgi:hypothetical protein
MTDLPSTIRLLWVAGGLFVIKVVEVMLLTWLFTVKKL